MSLPEVVVPGQPIVPILSQNTKYIAGKNCRIETITYNGSQIPSIVSSVVGKVQINESDGTVDVIGKNEDDAVQTVKLSSTTPKLGDLVLARVTKISTNRVNVEILSVDDGNEKQLMQANLATNENGEKFRGIIRSLDIRSTERDKVSVWECYQPGDIVRAEVISLGDGVNYYLSTAKNNLGVVLAKSKEGQLMYALDWETMVVPTEGGAIEKRKCAKPF